jgi:hypothetical protein
MAEILTKDEVDEIIGTSKRPSETARLGVSHEALRTALDAANMSLDLRCAQLLMVASQLGRDPKMDHADRSDPRWTPALHEAWCAVQKHREDAAQIVELLRILDAANRRADEFKREEERLHLDVHAACEKIEKAEADLADLRRKLDEADKECVEQAQWAGKYLMQAQAAETRLASAVGALKDVLSFNLNESGDYGEESIEGDAVRSIPVSVESQLSPELKAKARAALASQPVEGKQTGERPCRCDAPECLYYNGKCNAPCLGTRRTKEAGR